LYEAMSASPECVCTTLRHVQRAGVRARVITAAVSSRSMTTTRSPPPVRAVRRRKGERMPPAGPHPGAPGRAGRVFATLSLRCRHNVARFRSAAGDGALTGFRTSAGRRRRPLRLTNREVRWRCTRATERHR
jgi:hypothetical protein